MQIRETPWERRNLGVKSSAVFQFDENDTTEVAIREAVDNRRYAYQEATVPMGRVDILNTLLTGGFRFAEVAIRQTMKPECILPRAYERHLDEFTTHIADAGELLRVYEAIQDGNIFRTDKIALNPRFGPKIAARRYRYWVEDEIAQGHTEPFVVYYRYDLIGFSILKRETDRTVWGLLSGLIDSEKYKGFGIYLGYYLIQAARTMNAKLVVANASSNNPTILKINGIIGYRTVSMNYQASRCLENTDER